MPKLSDVLDLMRDVMINVDLFGAPIAWQEEFHKRLAALGRITCEEWGITPEQAKTISQETELGPVATSNFSDLKSWFHVS